MPAVVRGNGADTVFSKTGAGTNCAQPLVTATAECSSDVFVEGYGVVREDDQIQYHTTVGCVPDTSRLTTFSSTVYINGKKAARIGDKYTDDNTITSGSTTVFIGS